MRGSSSIVWGVSFLVGCAASLSGCAHGGGTKAAQAPSLVLKPLEIATPVELKLKADAGRLEKVAYAHRSHSRAFEDGEVRHQKDEALDFVSQAETVKKEPAKGDQPEAFTQVISVVKKDGTADLHDFAMPEEGERLEVTADSQGRILRSGDYPQNSIFYVPPISLPKEPVVAGDTWTMQATWLSLEEMIPYQLDMVSILKGFVACGKDRCADIEIGGEVTFQGPLAKTMSFKSDWKGRLLFAIDAGTVLWSRVDSDENFMADNVRREVNSCLEARLMEPAGLKLDGFKKAACEASGPQPPAAGQ